MHYTVYVRRLLYIQSIVTKRFVLDILSYSTHCNDIKILYMVDKKTTTTNCFK